VPIFAMTADVGRAAQIPSCFDRALTKPVDLDGIAGLVERGVESRIRAKLH
jgi:hypothetical protein